MATFLETVYSMDESIGYPELFKLATSGQHTLPEILETIREFIPTERLHISYILAMLLANTGHRHMYVFMALTMGGITFNNPKEQQRGMDGLRTEADQLSAEERKIIYDPVVAHTSRFLLSRTLPQKDNEQIIRIIEIMKAADPPLRTIFDWDEPLPVISMDRLRQQGQKQAKLLNHPLPAEGSPVQKKRVLVTGRKTFFQRGQGSRLFDIGPRMTAAMNLYGWQAELYSTEDSFDELNFIPEQCRKIKPDILILDDELLVSLHHSYLKMINRLRQEHPSLKIVGYWLDAWERVESLQSISHALDIIWDLTASSLTSWKDSEFAHKILCMPCPFVWDQGSAEIPLIPHMLFAGSIQGFNWHRAFWMAAIEQRKLPLTKKISSHAPDGLPALVSYGHYMQGLKEATCCLNLVMRPDHEHTRIVTGRTFEVLMSGSLLIQESAPGMGYFFIPGEHYLEFTTIAELHALVDFITENREEAEQIRQRGHQFACDHYSNTKLIGYLDKALFHPR